MFKQVKSAMFWYYLFKFRRRITLIFFLLLVALFSNAIYADIVQYLQLKNKLQYLEFVLSLKWIIILFNISFCIYLLLTLFKKEEKESKKDKKTEEKNILTKEEKNINSEKFTQREKQFLYKKKLNTKADFLIKNK